MHAESKELQPIEMPAGGYTCDYLKAVVRSAKLHIKPLQADLNLDPSSPEVMCKIRMRLCLSINNSFYRALALHQKRFVASASS